MEESSEKRRQRLQAMRTEASNQPEILSPCSSSVAPDQNLSNPMIDTFANERSPQLPRFDFYTDPMVAFSSARRRGGGGGRGGRGGEPYGSPESFSSPIRSPSPLSFPSNRPNAGPRNYQVASTHPPPSQQFQMNRSPNQSPWRSPNQFFTPLSSHTEGPPPHYTPNPHSWNNSVGGSPHQAFPPNYSTSRGGGVQSPSFRHGGSPSPNSNSGRGSGWRFRGNGRSGGRGHGSYRDQSSFQNEPSHFYLKTMVKDPWRKLKPIVGNILVPRSGSGSWLPKSIATPKRAKVVEVGAKSQLSLAESLALAMDEASDE